jgi:predicted RNA-binding protein with RPS1 domain
MNEPDVGDVIVVRVVDRHRWGLDVQSVDDEHLSGFVDVVAVSDEYIGGVADLPEPGSICDAVFLGRGSHDQLRFSLRRSDVSRARDGGQNVVND